MSTRRHGKHHPKTPRRVAHDGPLASSPVLDSDAAAPVPNRRTTFATHQPPELTRVHDDVSSLPLPPGLHPTALDDPEAAAAGAIALPTPPAHLLAAYPSPAAPPSSTPQDPHAQIAALAQLNTDADAALLANRAYQHALLQALTRVERVRERAAILQTLVTKLRHDLAPPAAREGEDEEQEEQEQDDGLRLHAPGMMEPALPYFKVMYGQDLPLNEDAKARERYLAAIHTRNWHSAERSKLRREVIAQNHRQLARKALQQGEDPVAALARRKEVDPEWFVRNTEGLDWDSLALVMDRRTAKACKIQWLSRDHPRINSNPKWAPDEKARLEQLVRRFKADTEGTWERVASELGMGRTPTMCARQWTKRAKPKDERTVWTPQDDDRLKAAVQQWGENWDVVARRTGRSANQCLHRYLHSLRPGVTHGRFTPAEDARIMAAVGVFGPRHHWAEVAARVGNGRTEAQCRERWNKSLNPEIHVKGSRDWTGEEDDTLVELHEVEGLGWAEIAQRAFGGQRSAGHVARRYEALQAMLDPEGAAAARAQDRAEKERKKRESEPVKKKRGRPRKVPLKDESHAEKGKKARESKRRKTG